MAGPAPIHRLWARGTRPRFSQVDRGLTRRHTVSLLSSARLNRPSTSPKTLPPPALADYNVGRLASLEHPLPAGMRDLLPSEAHRQAALSQRVMASLEVFGYQRVVVPVFEYADVLERGLGSLAPDAVLRFVEPESGEVVALRPDLTPQIARVLATRLADHPPPARLCYLGSVLRRRRERARRHRQIPQAGIELVGAEGPDGDLEVLSVAAAAVRAAGLQDFVVDLGDARIVSGLLQGVDPSFWAGIVDALSLKDTTALHDRAKPAGLSGRDLEALVTLPELHGGADVWARAERVLMGTAAEVGLRELRALWEAAQSRAIAPRLVVDFGETWNFAYYTGPMFRILAEGPGAAVGSGGRYDGLLGRFGLPRAAAGFAVDLDHLDWALREAHVAEAVQHRVLVAGTPELREPLLAELRQRGIVCSAAPASDAQGYARAWSYTHVIELSRAGSTLLDLSSSSSSSVATATAAELAAKVAALLGTTH